MKFIGFFVCLMMASCSSTAYKRRAPVSVEKVTYGNYEVHALHTPKDAGFVELWQVVPRKKIKKIKIYNVKINPFLEEDIQWVFIKEMYIEEKSKNIIILNEKNERYSMNINTMKVKKL